MLPLALGYIVAVATTNGKKLDAQNGSDEEGDGDESLTKDMVEAEEVTLDGNGVGEEE